MKRAFSVLSLVTGIGLAATQLSLAAESTATQDAIRKQAQEFIDAFDRGNAEAVAAQWSADGEYIIGRNSVKGRPAIARLYEEFFRRHAGSKMEVRIESIRVLAPTVAIEQGTASVRNNSGGPPSSSAYTAVHVKQDDKWLMANVRESEIPTNGGDTDLIDLAWLIGAWATNSDTAKIEMNFSWMANKHFLRSETTVATPDGPTSAGEQIIGVDPATGRIVSWCFDADGGHGFGEWVKDGPRWIINTQGTSADGAPTSSTNVLYHADDNVTSWQSVNRFIGDTHLPDAKEVVIERVSGGAGKHNSPLPGDSQ